MITFQKKSIDSVAAQPNTEPQVIQQTFTPPTNTPTVVTQFNITNWDLLRLLNGGTLDSKGQLFSIQTIRNYSTKSTYNNKETVMLTLQVITNGINNPVKRKDVLVKKIIEKQTIPKPMKLGKEVMDLKTSVESEEAW